MFLIERNSARTGADANQPRFDDLRDEFHTDPASFECIDAPERLPYGGSYGMSIADTAWVYGHTIKTRDEL